MPRVIHVSRGGHAAEFRLPGATGHTIRKSRGVYRGENAAPFQLFTSARRIRVEITGIPRKNSSTAPSSPVGEGDRHRGCQAGSTRVAEENLLSPSLRAELDRRIK